MTMHDGHRLHIKNEPKYKTRRPGRSQLLSKFFKRNTSSVKITKRMQIKCTECKNTFDCITDGKLNAEDFKRFMQLPNCRQHGG